MKTDKRIADYLIRGISMSGLPAVLRKFRPPELSILMFHGIAGKHYAGMLNGSDLHLRIDEFYGMCRLLAEKYRVISLDQAVAAIRGGESLPRRSVVLTFDDGYESNYRIGFPILRKFKLPATIFLATDFVHNKEYLWPDRIEYALHVTRKERFRTRLGGEQRVFSLKSLVGRMEAETALFQLLKAIPQSDLPREVGRIECELGVSLDEPVAETPAIYRPLSWEQIQEMRESGLISIGAHTHRHLILSRCTREVIKEELSISSNLIRENLGFSPTLFAYPNGRAEDYNAASRDALEAMGFQCALTTCSGFNGKGSDPFELRRHGSGRNPMHTDAMTSGALAFLKRLRSPFHHHATPSPTSPSAA